MDPAVASSLPSGASIEDAGVTALPVPTSRKNILPPIPAVSSSPPISNSALPGNPTNVDSSAETSKPASGSLAKNSRLTFKNAGTMVKMGLKAANAFSTLRDMGGATIQPSDLKTIRKLGEGAFAVVEEADYIPSATATVSPAAAATSTAGSAAAAATSPAGKQGPQQQGQQQQQQGQGGAAGSARRVAVKRLKPEVVSQQGDLAAFLTEVALLRKLAHKRIVQYVGVGSSDASSEEAKRRTMFLVQEFMDGGTLKRLLTRQMLNMSRQLYTCMDAFRWALHVAEGLDYLHSARPVVIHRDLKLENILLRGTEPATAEAKIADFGLVALVRPRDRGLYEQLQAAEAAHVAA
ncbi:hypothetical protein Agub_g5560, partial [Astrephomene gubernaculifera]